LKKSSQYNQELLWQRFEAAIRNNKVSLAGYVKNQMDKDSQATAQQWLDIHRKPERYIPKLLSQPQTVQAPLMFVHAIKRMSSSDINRAIELWDQNKDKFDISKTRYDRIEKQLAFKLALKNETGAYERLGQLDASDSNTKAWRIRVALYEQNWPRVITAIQDLSEDDQQSEKWQYWLARAYLETGKTEEAEKLLTTLATKRDFYGYLAADRVNSLYQLANNPIKVSSQEIEDIKNRDAFRVAFELMVLDRENEAKLQWWHALRSLNEYEIIAAAKLAQKWQWDEIAIFTVAKVQYWDDIEMRFPLSYADKIQENAVQQKLNPAIIFGLVRRESAFNKNARSPTGAQGLMQIMPKTGRQIARDLKERWTGKNSLYNPVKNLKYGSYYYQKLLNQFDGHYALALAAYNAGPNRVKQWLPDETIPADIWIETIPYRETRDYVTSVLAYTLIYQQRTNSNELSMNDFTRDVKPLLQTP
jgi:soluble lytic murein transglycosylase